MSERWRSSAEMVTDGDFRILGEDDRGDLYVPRVAMFNSRLAPFWRDRYNPWNPTHWRYWLRSRLTLRIAFLEHI